MNIRVEKGATVQCSDPADSGGENSRPKRTSARKATDQVREWIRMLSAPPEDVTEKNRRTCE